MNPALIVSLLAAVALVAGLVVDTYLLRHIILTRPSATVSRSKGGVVGADELTRVGEDGPEYASLPAGTSVDLLVLLESLAAGSVMIIVGANGKQDVRLPPGTVVHTAEQTIDMLRSGGRDAKGETSEQ